MPGSHQQGLIYSKINSNQRRVKPTLKGVNPVQLSSFFITTNRYRVRITADAAQIHLSISHSILPSLVDKTQGYLIQTILDSLHDFILRRFPWSCITDFNFRKDHYFLAILGYIYDNELCIYLSMMSIMSMYPFCERTSPSQNTMTCGCFLSKALSGHGRNKAS